MLSLRKGLPQVPKSLLELPKFLKSTKERRIEEVGFKTENIINTKYPTALIQ